MAVGKSKDTEYERHASLIPVLEKEELRLRAELEEVRRDAENQIRQAEEQAEKHVRQNQLNISELVNQKREEGLVELQKRAEQLSRSSKTHSADLQQQIERNMAQAVRKVVDTVTSVGDET